MQLNAKAILAAALALPGVRAIADEPPEQAEVRLQYLHYADRQPGLSRITVHSPSVWFLVPVAGKWAFEGSLTSDAVSGATPQYHTAISGASRMQDTRNAADIKVTRYFARSTFSVGAAYSTEHDYVSRALSLQGGVSSDDRNTTWTAGIGVAHDSINPVNQAGAGEKRETIDVMGGVTQVLSPRDIARLFLTYTHGRGYFSDPYKFPDNRPRKRGQRTLLARWNHHFDGSDGTARVAYRLYSDTWKIVSHTFGLEYVQPLQQGWTVTPLVRIYTQSAASVYADPVYDATLGPPFPTGYDFGGGQLTSTDQRLSAFGARSFGLKVAKQIGRDLTIDLKLEAYRQRSGWRLFGSGSPGLDSLSARIVQVGISKKW
jgi:hypothetical protein